MEKEKILILTINKFPNGDAGAVRQYAFSKLLHSIGYAPYVVGMGKTTNFRDMEYEGIKYTSLRATKTDLISRVFAIINYKKRLKSLLRAEENTYKKILVVDIPFNALLWLKKYVKKRNIMLLHDSVEWYSPEQFKYGMFSLQFILKDLYNRYWIDKQFRVIAISKYLESHFKGKGLRTLIIPVIMDIENMSCKKATDPEKLTIVYAGAPGKKDYLKEVVEGIALLSKSEIDKIDLRLIGINKNQLVDMCDVSLQSIEKLGNCLSTLGRVSRESVLKNLEEADFTVLIRSSTLRYAKAGFSTKVVESLASATPVICNITSDLGDYIVDMQNGIIVEECTAEAFSIAVKKALNISFEERRTMYESARKCAKGNFDYKLYGDSVKQLVKNTED